MSTAFMQGKPSAISEIDEIQDRLRKLAAWLNQRSAWKAALATQQAIIAVDNIHGGNETDLEESYP